MNPSPPPPVDPTKDDPFPGLRDLPKRFTLPQEVREQVIRHLREDLSSLPFHAKKAAEEAARSGDEMAYWRDLYGSAQYRQRPAECYSVDGVRLDLHPNWHKPEGWA